MRAVVQRVTYSKVTVENKTVGEIGKGLNVLLGIGKEDGQKDIEYLVDKIINLRIFEDENGKMNVSLKDINGQLIVVSQFTLYGDCRRGRRPGFDRAARPEDAEKIYNRFIEECKKHGVKVETGKFQAMMSVEIHNDGPVTILLDSKKEF
ncbi:D-aminoacyl-tRNA deacylase [Acetivibrio saccincola]|jgi:D-tyrosyl-tRNA(Tyr) deacylase|uniref:D-aminoacyl-tRNA deacylase n=1 Tax=Acetivibrio saccincola TaxID=1677857 RepID=A0A2K9E446_9FIRM|nr:D-aminoacyl-tRNA deacylase [Acetivibrio saccincola]AUG58159.1 D-tyrosyl-tRNA(Tyr) deacylase [Acetivibrio saccincola]NLW26718.1 D-tyrosyl-tRNA(Tyr) deacylase [Acetivibrio saccincola]PQQ68040.1 D-tyrosyl-tRNA(Tyr) deacylase [Acetivibrio saccincola]HOA97741.1 D-aminoacyl-tRNA deacylase [Acetivibrio saccincola]HQD27706.1 D-aminoacyl-tRNA deacylase [Acetivibrio saccincola]